LAKAFFDCSLRLLGGEALNLDYPSDGQSNFAALVYAQFLRQLGGVEDPYVQQIAGVE
jgi:hypothetical protein